MKTIKELRQAIESDPAREGEKKMTRWNVIERNIWTREERIAETALDATVADQIAMRILLDQPNYVAWREPVQGWEAESKRAAAIAEEWMSWRTANGF
jgi:hypothetical protein